MFLWCGRLWPKPTLAKPTLTCGVLCLCVVCCCVVVVVLLLLWWYWFHSFMVWGSRVGVGFKVLVMFGAPGPPKMQARALGPPGFHTTTREPKRGHLRVLSFKKHQNSREGPPRKRRKNENCGGRKEKKNEFLGGPVEGGPVVRWKAQGGPNQQPHEPQPQTPHEPQHNTTQHTDH